MDQSTRIDLRREISRHLADFVREHGGGEAAEVKTFFFGNLLAIFVTTHPLPHGPKKKQTHTGASVFDRVAPQIVRNFFERITRCNVTNLYLIAGQQGRQLVIVALNQDLESRIAAWSAAQSRLARDWQEIENSIDEMKPEAPRDEAIWLARNVRPVGAGEGQVARSARRRRQEKMTHTSHL